MAIETYGGSALGKLGLSVLGKATGVSVATFALTLGTAVLVVVAGALVIKEIADIKIIGKKKSKSNQM